MQSEHKKILIVMLLGIFLVVSVSALTYKQSTNFDVNIVCINAGFCSASADCNVSVFDPKGIVLLDGVQATQSASLAFFNISLDSNQSSVLGEYQVGGFCKDGSVTQLVDFTFDVTPTGEITNSIGFFIIVYSIFFLIIGFGFVLRNEWMAILGGMGLIFMGIFTFNSGIVIFKNVTTQVVSLITIAFGAIISILTSLSLIDNNL